MSAHSSCESTLLNAWLSLYSLTDVLSAVRQCFFDMVT